MSQNELEKIVVRLGYVHAARLSWNYDSKVVSIVNDQFANKFTIIRKVCKSLIFIKKNNNRGWAKLIYQNETTANRLQTVNNRKRICKVSKCLRN